MRIAIWQQNWILELIVNFKESEAQRVLCNQVVSIIVLPPDNQRLLVRYSQMSAGDSRIFASHLHLPSSGKKVGLNIEADIFVYNFEGNTTTHKYVMSINLRDGLLGQTVDHVLEDLLVRFVINVPDEDLSSIERVFFQVEEAQWFYTDFARMINPEMPSMKMKSFAPKILSKCPLLWKWGDPADALPRFGKYKSTIPVRGIAMLNKDMTKVVLLKGLESNTWSFPRGKISKGEADLECAIRETREETGFDARDYISENAVLERTIYGKNFKIYLAKGVSEDEVFEPLVRNEIAEIRWFDIKNLLKLVKNSPNKYFVVNTLLKPLTKWINGNKGLVSDEQLMKEAEVKLKALMGITPSTQTNADAGRELLDILQGAKPEALLPIASVSGTPILQPQEQFIQMSLPQHLQSVYSGFAHMPQFFSPFTQGLNHYPMVSPPEFTAPHFKGPIAHSSQERSSFPNQQVQASQKSSLPLQAQTLNNSKELLSILKGTASKKEPVALESPTLKTPRAKPNSSEEILLILKQNKPKSEVLEDFPTETSVSLSRPDTPSRKITLLKRDRMASDENASATLLGILGKKPPIPAQNPSQSSESLIENEDNTIIPRVADRKSVNKDAPPKLSSDRAASAEIMNILNKPTEKSIETPPSRTLKEPHNATFSHSAALLNVLNSTKPSPVKNEDASAENARALDKPKMPIRLAKRGDDAPANLKILFESDEKTSKLSPQQPASDLSAGNQIMRFIGNDVKDNKEISQTANQNDGFEDFEDFENFDDFDDSQGPQNHIYDLINNNLDAQTDEEEIFEGSHTQKLMESHNDMADFLHVSHDMSAQKLISTYQDTYGSANAGMYEKSFNQQPKRTPSTNGADLLLLLRRN